MEQFFIVLAVLAVWIFRGVAGAKSRYPGGDASDGESLGPGGSIDISARTRQRTLEAQQRAIEALQRWEEKQGLGSRPHREAGAPEPGVRTTREMAPAARTRTARPAQFSRRTTAERKRREAYAEIANMLDPSQSGRAASRRGRGFEAQRMSEAAAAGSGAPEAVSLEDPAELEALMARREQAASSADSAKRRASGRTRSAPTGGDPGPDKPEVIRLGRAKGRRSRTRIPPGLARLEELPLPARAIVYAEILGSPRSLT